MRMTLKISITEVCFGGVLHCCHTLTLFASIAFEILFGTCMTIVSAQMGKTAEVVVTCV